MVGHHRAGLSLPALVLASVLVGCGASGGALEIPAEAEDAQAETCGVFMDLEFEEQEELAGHLAAAEQRENTPRVRGVYRDTIYDKCFDSVAEEPIGQVDAWRLPVPSKLDFANYGRMNDEQIQAAFPSYNDWLGMGVELDQVGDAEAAGEGEDNYVWITRTEEFEEAYAYELTSEQLCASNPYSRPFDENPDLVSGMVVHASQSGKEYSGGVTSGSTSYFAEIVTFDDHSTLQSFLDATQNVIEGDYQCDPEMMHRSVSVDVSDMGVPDAVGVYSTWPNHDTENVDRHKRLALEVEVGDGQLLIIGLPVPSSSPEVDSIDEDIALYSEKQAAMARWLYRSLGGEQDLPDPTDTLGTGEL